jgi:mono/diheme cytochrome c family protein
MWPVSCRQIPLTGDDSMKVLKYVAIGLGLLIVLAAAVFGGAFWMGERKLGRVVEVRVVPVPYTKDPATVKQGKYLFESRGCGECHGMDGRGRDLIQTSAMFIHTPNITPGPRSAVAAYTEADWVRALRHGVDPRGRALFLMPSEDYNRMTDADLAAVIAYTKSLAPVDAPGATVQLSAFIKALYGAGAIPDAAERIDHRLPPAAPVPVAVSVEHGAYVANMCLGCHGTTLAGGPIPGAPPEWPPAANLTPGQGGVMGRYDTPEKFVQMMRTGKRPDGGAVDKAMPFASLANMNDTDLRAMHAYLLTLPARKTGAN